MKRTPIVLLSLLTVVFLMATFVIPVDIARAETLYVFSNRDVTDASITQTELKNIYLGKKDKWSDNQKVVCTTLNPGPCFADFIKQYVKISDLQYQNYWKKQIFTGTGQPPRGFDSEADLVDYVSKTTGAIGYSCSQPDTGKVKIMTVN